MVDYNPDKEMVEIIIVGSEENQKSGTCREAEKVDKTINKSQFKQFDFVSSAAQDEKGITYNSASSSSPSNQQINHNSTEKHDRIMQEWERLKTGLPESTYVRVYENNVARAVIIGGAGTLYRDGLFFFDIILPPSYPNVPPEVHSYYTCALSYLQGAGIDTHRIDTRWSLYQSDKLLVAKWNPNTSTILDILLSIQLVFQTENPQKNNHGMNINDPRLQKGFKIGFRTDESFDSNERLFKANCLTMLAILKNPPKHFEEFVAQHFRDRAETILTLCNRFKIRRGNYPKYKTKMCREYHDSMINVYSKLLKAFIKNGSSLDGFIGDINLDDVDDSDYVDKLTYNKIVVIMLIICALLIICGFGGAIVGIVQAINKTLS
ncbi:hypothetical protein MKW92_035788 [Papaver armeniacum]|nr:hypothetical protein MKW92_035788 [Papaver armeniacum]